MKEWLIGRQYIVTLWRKVLSGVSMGSVIGTFLFIIHINGVLDNTNCNNIAVSAEDTKFGGVATNDEKCNSITIQLNENIKMGRYVGNETS